MDSQSHEVGSGIGRWVDESNGWKLPVVVVPLVAQHVSAEKYGLYRRHQQQEPHRAGGTQKTLVIRRGKMNGRETRLKTRPRGNPLAQRIRERRRALNSCGEIAA